MRKLLIVAGAIAIALSSSSCEQLTGVKPAARQCKPLVFRLDSLPDSLVVRRCP